MFQKRTIYRLVCLFICFDSSSHEPPLLYSHGLLVRETYSLPSARRTVKCQAGRSREVGPRIQWAALNHSINYLGTYTPKGAHHT